MKHAIFVYNPFSGDGSVLGEIDNIIKTYQKFDTVLTPYRLCDDILNLKNFLLQFPNVDHILIAGGDGTINNIVNLIKAIDLETPIAFLPTGTANDFASLLGLGGSSVEECCKKILSSKPRGIDLGYVNGKYFINVLSMGVFTDVSQKINPAIKNTFGKIGYYFSGIGELANFKPLSIDVISKEYSYTDKSIIVFVFNGQTAGSMAFGKLSSIDDGLLDVIIIKNEVKSILSIIKFINTTNDKLPSEAIYFKTDSLEIKSNENINTDIDGEKGPDFPLKITCKKRAIKILGYN